MIALPEMLVVPAEKAGIKVPQDVKDYDAAKYPHFYVFSRMQLGAPMPHATVVWDNAQVIAAVPDDEIEKVTFNDLVSRGYQIGNSRMYGLTKKDNYGYPNL